MLEDFQPGFPSLNRITLLNYANWTAEQRAEYEQRKQRAENILTAIRARRVAERAEESRHSVPAKADQGATSRL
jgi:hypothetical protein